MSKQEETRDRVLDLVESVAVGQPIPAERQLALDLGVSRLTLRAALDELVRDGYLERRHGSGTSVTEPKIAQPLTLTSFSDDMRRRGMTPRRRTLELTTTVARARLAHRRDAPPARPLARSRRSPRSFRREAATGARPAPHEVPRQRANREATIRTAPRRHIQERRGNCLDETDKDMVRRGLSRRGGHRDRLRWKHGRRDQPGGSDGDFDGVADERQRACECDRQRQRRLQG